MELLTLIRVYDDTFAQEVHARSSYRHSDIEWHRRYRSPVAAGSDARVVLDLDKLDDSEPLND